MVQPASKRLVTEATGAVNYNRSGMIGQRKRDVLPPAGPIRTMAVTAPTVTLRGSYALYASPGVTSVTNSVFLDRPALRTLVTPIGGIIATSGNYLSNYSEASQPEYPPYSLEFWHQGATLEFVIQQYSLSQQYRLWVDDVAVTATPQAPATVTDNTINTLQVDFASRGTRKIRLDYALLGLRGLYLGPNDTIWPTQPPADKVVFLGDSWTSGVGATSTLNTWALYAARRLRWGHPYLLGQGSTGWLNPATGTKDTFVNRIAKDVVSAAPETMVVMGGYNDVPSKNAAYTAAALQTAVSTFITSAFSQLPTLRRLIIAGAQQPASPPAAELTAATSSISAACSAAATAGLPVSFVDMTGWFGTTTATGFGTGSIATLINQSGPSAAHPTDEGHEYVGQRFASAVVPLLAS